MSFLSNKIFPIPNTVSDTKARLNHCITKIQKEMALYEQNCNQKAKQKIDEDIAIANLHARSFFTLHHTSLVDDTLEFFLAEMENGKKPPYQRQLTFKDEILAYHKDFRLNEKMILKDLLFKELSNFFDSDVSLIIQCVCLDNESRVIVAIDLSFEK